VLGKICFFSKWPASLGVCVPLGMRRLRIKRDTHRDAVFCRHELDGAGASSKALLDQLVGHDLGYVPAAKSKPKLPVLGFHCATRIAHPRAKFDR